MDDLREIATDAARIWLGWLWPAFAAIGFGSAMILAEIWLSHTFGLWGLLANGVLILVGVFILATVKAMDKAKWRRKSGGLSG